MQMRAVLVAAILVSTAGCGRSGMSLDAAFEAKARAVPVTRDAEPPRTTQMSFGRTRVSSFRFSSVETRTNASTAQTLSNVSGFVGAARTLAPEHERELSGVATVLDASALLVQLAGDASRREEQRELAFQVNHDNERIESMCASTLRFEPEEAPPRQAALACVFVTSQGSEFALRMQSGGGVHGSIARVGDRARAPLFELDGRGGWATTSGSRSTVELAGFSVRRGGAEVAAIELPHAVPNANAWLTGALLTEEQGVVLAAFAAITSVRWPGDTAFHADDA